MARNRQAPQRYRPVNFNNVPAPRRAPAARAQVEYIPAIEIQEPRVIVPIDNNIKVSKKYSKKYRFVRDYKVLKPVNDDITHNYTTAIQNYKFSKYENEALDFNIWDKVQAMSKSINKTIAGGNSWTNQIYSLDYTPEQYDNLNYINRPTLDEVARNKYLGELKSDQRFLSNLRSIINNSNVILDPMNLIEILKHHRQIMLQMFLYRYLQKQSPNTYGDDIRTLQRLAKISLGEKDELYLKLGKLFDDYDKAVLKDIDTNNMLNVYEERNFVPYGNLLDMIDDMEAKFRDSLQQKGADHYQTYKLHMNTLILMSYLYTPPVRSELSNMTITTTLERLNEKTNYVYIPEDTAKVIQYVFNTVHKKHPPITYDVGYPNENEQEDPLAKRLSAFARESLQLYPRTYYLTQWTDKAKVINDKNLRDYLKIMFEGQTLGINAFRSSYVSWLFSNNVSTKILDQVALKMRSSPTTFMRSYKKLNTEQQKIKQEPRDDDDGSSNTPIIVQENGAAGSEAPQPPIVRHVMAQPRFKERYVDPVAANKTYQQRYRERIGPEILKERVRQAKQANKEKYNLTRVLNKYNSGADPKPSFIRKYDLYKDGNIWKSRL